MALLFVEGFEEYNTGTGVTLANEVVAMRSRAGYRWHYGYVNSTVTLSATVYRCPQGTAARSLRLSNAHLDIMMPTLTEIIVGMAVHFSEVESTSFLVLSNSHSVSTSIPSNGIRLRRSAGGELEIVNNNNNAVIGVTPVPCLMARTWTYVEFRYVFGASGELQVRVENQELLHVTGIDTRGGATAIQNMALWSSTSSAYSYFDDLYICDSSGPSNNSFLGPIVVHTLTPNEDVRTEFSRNTGATNFSCVNEIPHNSDTSYIFSGTEGARELLGLTDIVGAVGPIVGLQANARTRCEGGSRSFAFTAESSGGTSVGGAKSPTTSSWSTDFEIFEKQANGADWSATEVNSAKLGFDIVGS